MLQKALLDLHGPHHPGADHAHEARNVVASGILLEGPKQGLGEGVADDGEAVGLPAVDGRQAFLGVKAVPLEGQNAAPLSQRAHGRK